MSSLRFVKPIYLEELSEEAAKEWVGLSVNLTSGFPLSIGYLGPAKKTWCDIEQVAHELTDRYLFVSHEALIHACKYAEPRRAKLLHWLTETNHYEYFAVSEQVAEYLP